MNFDTNDSSVKPPLNNTISRPDKRYSFHGISVF